MVLYIIPYHIISDLLSHCSIEIPLLPKVTSPKLLFHLRKLLEDLAARNTLQDSNHPCNRIPRWERNQYVHMILGDLTSVYFKIKMACYLEKKLFDTLSNFLNEDLFPILWAPYKMILSFVHCMACSFQARAGILLGNCPFLKPYGNNHAELSKGWFCAFHLRPKAGAFKRIFS